MLIDIGDGDKHSAAIEQNRIGLVRGAEARFGQGVIDAHTRDRIVQIVGAAGMEEFTPFMLAIPFKGVKSLVKLAPVNSSARATSEEYILTDLPRAKFDVLRLAEIRK